jgi:hypothetical protein
MKDKKVKVTIMTTRSITSSPMSAQKMINSLVPTETRKKTIQSCANNQNTKPRNIQKFIITDNQYENDGF